MLLLASSLAAGCNSKKENQERPEKASERKVSDEKAPAKTTKKAPAEPAVEPIEGPNPVFVVWMHSDSDPASRAMQPRLGVLQRRTRRPGNAVSWMRLDFSTDVSTKKAGITMAKLRLVKAFMSVKAEGNKPKTGIALLVDGKSRDVLATLKPEQSDAEWAAAMKKAIGAK